MRYSLRTALTVAVAFTAVAVGQELQSPDSRAVVEALLKRSRELEDVRFCVPQALWKQYLREQLGGPSPAGPGAPVPWIAEAGLYRLTVAESGKGVLEATVRIRVFDALPAKNLAVLSAARAWKNLTLTAGGGEAVPVELPANDGFLRFSPPAAGVFILKGLTDVKGDRVPVEIPATVVTGFEFAGPSGVEGRIEGREDVIPAVAGKPTAGALALAPCTRFTISYGPPPVAFERTPRYQLQGTVAWNLDADVQHVTADLGVDVLVGRSDRIELALPEGADRVKISGPEVREVQGGTVFLRGQLRGQVRLSVEFDLRYGPGASRTLSGLGLREGRWTGGTLLIAGGGGEDEILPERADGLTERTLIDLPPQAKAMLRGQPVAAYGITGSAWSASVEALKLGQFAMRESIADLAHYQVALQADGAMMCKAQYEIRNRSQQFLRLALPAGATVLLARVNEKAQPLVPLPERPGVFVLPLVRSDATVKGLVTFPVEIVYMVRTSPLVKSGMARLPLPTLDIPVAYAWGEAYLPEGLTVRRWAGPMQQVAQFSSETAVASIGYGAGELAAGYKAEGRIHAETVNGKKPAPAKAAKERSGRPSVVTIEETPKGKPTSGAGRTPEVVGKGEGKGKGPGKDEQTETGKTKDRTFGNLGGFTKLPALELQDVASGKPKAPDRTDGYAAALGKNYWRTGQGYYQQGNYESAEKALRKVTELAPGSQDAENASRLLSNIDVVRGQAKLTGAQEKAAGKGVQQEAAQQRQDLSRQQYEVLAKGFEALKAGDRSKAQLQFQAAQAYNPKLLEQGETAKEQDALLAQARREMQATAAAEQAKARELIGQAKQLEQKKDYAQALNLAKSARQRLKANEFGIDAQANASISGDARQAGELVEKLTIAAAQDNAARTKGRKVEYEVSLATDHRNAREVVSIKSLQKAGASGESGDPDASEVRPVTNGEPIVLTEELAKLVPADKPTAPYVYVYRGQTPAGTETTKDQVRMTSADFATDRLEERDRRSASVRAVDSLKQMESLGYVGGSTQPAARGQPVTTPPPPPPVVVEGPAGITVAEKEWKPAEPSKPDKYYGGAIGSVRSFSHTGTAAQQTESASNAQPYGDSGDGEMGGFHYRGISPGPQLKAGAGIANRSDLVPTQGAGEARWRDEAALGIRRQSGSTGAIPGTFLDDVTGDFQVDSEQAKAFTDPTIRIKGASVTHEDKIHNIVRGEQQVLRDSVPQDVPARGVPVLENVPVLGRAFGGPVANEAQKEQMAISLQSGREAEIPWYMEVSHPDDWREKTVRDKTYRGEEKLPAPAEPVVERTYDIKDMVVNVPNFTGPRIDISRLGQNQAGEASGRVEEGRETMGLAGAEGKDQYRTAAEKVTQSIRSSVAPDSWRELERAGGAIQINNGRLVVRQTEANQRQIANLLGELREARGARVQEGEKLLTQKANAGDNNTFTVNSQTRWVDSTAAAGERIGASGTRDPFSFSVGWIDDISNGEGAAPPAARQDDVLANDPEFRKFVEDNYAWANDRSRRPGQTPASAPAMPVYDQKTNVTSWNVKVDEASAARLGLKFQAGRNDVRYTVVDEAQLRTLAELEASRGAAAAQVARNPRRQDTIVGTDALLANGMTANASYAADRGNVLDVGENPIALSHERYLLVSNGAYLTAVRSLPMANWKDASPYVEVIEAPQKIDIPRVGVPVRFEKKLAGADEALELSVTYEWKGAHE
ncbi:MAG: hypothetical protein NTV86_17530 [Planctomycetota bacterium]|nr:hypothetical protein [Planctomycetota bacterium]